MALPQTLTILRNRLRTAKEAVAASAGPLAEPQKSTVQSNLTGAQSDISSALAELSAEGDADTNVPSTLPDIAALCENLADSAYQHSLENPRIDSQIASEINTIDYLIDATDGYRDRAGIT